MYAALTEHGLSSSSTLRTFFADPQTTGLLAGSLVPLPSPSPKTRAVFDTKTSAINVSPSENSHFDIRAIKQDTVWLSKTADIDEISALRIAVLEWQERPAAQLLKTSSGLPSQIRSIGDHSLNTRNSLRHNGEDNPGNEEVRHLALLQTHLSERRYLLKVAETVLSYLSRVSTLQERTLRSPSQEPEDNWLVKVGKSLLSTWTEKPQSTKDKPQSFVSLIVEAAQARVEQFLQGCPWTVTEDAAEEISEEWTEDQIIQLIHILQIGLFSLQTLNSVVDPDDVIIWFRFMSDVAMFEGLREPFESLRQSYDLPVQSLAVLFSLRLLDIPSALDILADASTSGVFSAEAHDRLPYVLIPALVNELNDILVNLAEFKVASPISLAWGIVTQTLREMALAAKEARETRQSMRAVDQYGTLDSSDTEGGERSRDQPPLRRRTSNSSDTSLQMTLVEEIQDALTVTLIGQDSVQYLAKAAVHENNVFDVLATIAIDFCTTYCFEHDGVPGGRMRGILLDLIRCSVDYIQYQPALISTTVAVLTGSERFWDSVDDKLITYEDKPSNLFIRDSSIRFKILLQAASRFPYESLPFLQVCRGLAFQYTSSSGETSLPWNNLEELDIFTCRLPENFLNTTPVLEEEDESYLKLTGHLTLHVGSAETDLLTQRVITSESRLSAPETIVTIPAGTTGVIQSETRPFIVGWNFHYQGLAYIGLFLQSAMNTTSASEVSDHPVSQVLVAEIIYLLNTLLVSAIKDPSGDPSKSLESAHSILNQASDGMSQSQDVVSVVLQLFENELYRTQQISADDVSLNILARCSQFVFVILKVMPDRIWPYLGRSGLIGVGRDEPQFGYVLAQEISIGSYDFLIGCVRLYQGLVEDALTHCVSRQAPPRSLLRFGSPEKTGSGTSLRTMQDVLLNLSRCMMDVFESSTHWKWPIPEDRMEVVSCICATFERILVSCYVIDENHDLDQKLSRALAPCAEYIVQAFLSTANNDLVVHPLITIFSLANHLFTTTLPTKKTRTVFSQTRSALHLATTLLAVNTIQTKAFSHLEVEIFKAAATLTRLYAAHQSYRLPVVKLFSMMLRSAARSDRPPPSLLGHLGHQESNYFLTLLSRFDQPLQDPALSEAIWEFLSAVVSKRQQWFATYVLTGSTPRETLQKDTTSSKQSEPMLTAALDCLSDVDKVNPLIAVAILKFVASAADYWPWVFLALDSHPKFLKSMSEFVARAGSRSSSLDPGEGLPQFINLEMVSQATRILAMYAHYTQQTDNLKFARGLVPHLNYLIKNAVTTPSYNVSLHGNLRQNFSRKFPGCDLDNFKRTELVKPTLGDSFYYDMSICDTMLAYEPAWSGRKGQGFAEEFRRANINLSLVEAQINLFSSWKSLLMELSEPLANELKFQKIMAMAVTDCLQTNFRNSMPQVIFERLAASRAELVFTLMQKLVEVKSVENEAKDVLSVVWSSFVKQSNDLESVLRSDEADYHRALLNALYLSIQLHVLASRSAKDDATDPKLLHLIYEVLSKCVAPGFRSLAVVQHISPQLVLPTDFAMITAILRSCLQIPDLEKDSSRLLAAFSDSQTAQCAATLLSWSDHLAASTSNDPILGELSLGFLVELSSDTTLAESLAVDGVLSQVLSTNVVRVLQSRNFTPSDEPRRMYAIWTRGLIPLMLNLLNAIGPPIAAEVTAALNLFPYQLKQASNNIAATTRSSREGNAITLAYANEIHNLSLITSILRTFREAGASAAISAREIGEILNWDPSQVLGDVEACLQSRASLRERIVPMDAREEGWARCKASRESLSESLLEEKIVRELGGVVGALAGQGVEG